MEARTFRSGLSFILKNGVKKNYLIKFHLIFKQGTTLFGYLKQSIYRT